jgi:methylmalonyl-CoA mutase cobalamin-binding subunit
VLRCENIISLLSHAHAGAPPKVVVGGVIPEEDFKPLYDAGVVAIFGKCIQTPMGTIVCGRFDANHNMPAHFDFPIKHLFLH